MKKITLNLFFSLLLLALPTSAFADTTVSDPNSPFPTEVVGDNGSSSSGQEVTATPQPGSDINATQVTTVASTDIGSTTTVDQNPTSTTDINAQVTPPEPTTRELNQSTGLEKKSLLSNKKIIYPATGVLLLLIISIIFFILRSRGSLPSLPERKPRERKEKPTKEDKKLKGRKNNKDKSDESDLLLTAETETESTEDTDQEEESNNTLFSSTDHDPANQSNDLTSENQELSSEYTTQVAPENLDGGNDDLFLTDDIEEKKPINFSLSENFLKENENIFLDNNQPVTTEISLDEAVDNDNHGFKENIESVPNSQLGNLSNYVQSYENNNEGNQSTYQGLNTDSLYLNDEEK